MMTDQERQERMQECLNKVWDWFIVQGHPRSIDSDGSCFYRRSGLAYDPVRCAFGLFIPDEVYDPVIESVPVDGFFNPFRPSPIPAQVKKWFNDFAQDDEVFVDFLKALQYAHDTINNDMQSRLRIIANEYELQITDYRKQGGGKCRSGLM
jgi:hypothetical protein